MLTKILNIGQAMERSSSVGEITKLRNEAQLILNKKEQTEIESTKNGALQNIIKRLFCTHDYNLINHKEVESEFEMIAKLNYKPTTHHSTTRLIITDYKCSCCGKIKRLTAKTPS